MGATVTALLLVLLGPMFRPEPTFYWPAAAWPCPRLIVEYTLALPDGSSRTHTQTVDAGSCAALPKPPLLTAMRTCCEAAPVCHDGWEPLPAGQPNPC